MPNHTQTLMFFQYNRRAIGRDLRSIVTGLNECFGDKYAEDRTTCEVLIEPEPSVRQPDDKDQSMAVGTVSKIIDELIPVSERGILVNRSIEDLGGNMSEVMRGD